MTRIANRRWTPLSIFAVIMGFVFWWPLGLAAIAYILWGGSFDTLLDRTVAQAKSWVGSRAPVRSSGNVAFDAYRAETIRRLEQEEAEFSAYVARLREARDREEFDRFLAERRQTATE